jgi:uncharacterized protein (DUF2345 family)
VAVTGHGIWVKSHHARFQNHTPGNSSAKTASHYLLGPASERKRVMTAVLI